MSDKEVSIGKLYESLDGTRQDMLRISKVTTEFYEKQLAGAMYDLSSVVSDLIYLVRDHLSCHDCQVVDHTHDTGEFASSVEQVYDGVVSRVDG